MHSLNQSLYRLGKTSIVVATLLCALCSGLSSLPVNAQAQDNGVSVFKRRLQEQLTSSNRSQRAEETNSVAEPPSASTMNKQERNFQDFSAQKKTTIAGTWFLDTTLTSPPEIAGPGIKLLHAFTEDGRAFNTGQGDNIPPVLSPGFGSWENLGGRTFALSFTILVYDTAGGTPPGTFLGLATALETVTLDESGNTLVGTFKFVQHDTDGNVVFTAEGTLKGIRIKG